MNELKIFNSEEFGSVRAFEMNGEPWFVGKDIAAKLGYRNLSDALLRHTDEDDRKTLYFRDYRDSRLSKLWKNEDRANKVIINESGLYSLIFCSELESARRFKHWVTSEILPSIRRTGMYVAANSDTFMNVAVCDKLAEMDKKLKIMSEREEILMSHIVSLTNMVESLKTSQINNEATRTIYSPLDSILNHLENLHEETLGIGQIAEIWSRFGVSATQSSLFMWLRNARILRKDGRNKNYPYKKFIRNGWFSTINYSYNGKIYTKTLLTSLGQVEITKLYLAACA